MSLTDPKLPITLITLSCLIFAALISFWNRLSKKGVKTVLARVLSLVLLNLLIVSSLGVVLNNYGQFYSSWGELFGVRSKPPLIVNTPNEKISRDMVKLGKLSPEGSLTIRRIVRGEVSGITGEVYFSLPPSYVNALKSGVAPRNDYPVVTFLSGYPGYETAWIKGMQVVSREESLLKAGKMPEVISVFPQVNVAGQFDAECMNVVGGPQVESWLSQDVYSFTNQWLDISPQPWNIVGYSTGGWCATMLTLRHPDHFAKAASIAGYYRPTPAKQVTPEEKVRLKNEYDLYALITRSQIPVSVLVVNSTDDRGSHASTNEFLRRTKGYLKTTEIVLNGVGHNFNAWKEVVNPILIWFFADSGVQK